MNQEQHLAGKKHELEHLDTQMKHKNTVEGLLNCADVIG